MTRRKWIVSAITTGFVVLASLGGMALAGANQGRPDCPGQIVCPVTGKLVCKDRCPLN